MSNLDSPGRDMRGASYMDQYDSANTGYDDKSKDDGDLEGCAKCTKHTLFAVNFIMLLIGVALIVVVFFVKNSSSGDTAIGLSDTVVWLAVASGALIIIVSFLGCIGATTKSKCVLIVFIILLVLCLVVELAGIIIMFAGEDLLKNSAEKRWDNLSVSQKEKYENDNNCSGFDGCYSSIQTGLENNMMIIGGITIGIFVYQLVMTIFACCLCTKLFKKQNHNHNVDNMDSYEV
eukprot:UN11042